MGLNVVRGAGGLIVEDFENNGLLGCCGVEPGCVRSPALFS